MSPPLGSPSSICVGAVNYLNARPLLHTLPRRLPEAKIVVDFPSRLADGLADGRFDVALIPSIEYLRQPGLRIASLRGDRLRRAGAERQAVWPRADRARGNARLGRRFAAPALAQILIRERFGLKPCLLSLPLEKSPASSPAEHMVVIGDRGMLDPDEELAFTWDLGEEWSLWTGLPFVFALWAARPHVQESRIDRALAAARDEGLTYLPEIARQASPEVGIPEAECLSYLRDNLEFHLGPRQREALDLFYNLAKRHGLG